MKVKLNHNSVLISTLQKGEAMRKFFKILISVVITLYFSATMFYCFVAGTPDDGKGAVIYMMSAAGLSILFPTFTCGCIHYILYLRKNG